MTQCSPFRFGKREYVSQDYGGLYEKRAPMRFGKRDFVQYEDDDGELMDKRAPTTRFGKRMLGYGGGDSVADDVLLEEAVKRAPMRFGK